MVPVTYIAIGKSPSPPFFPNPSQYSNMFAVACSVRFSGQIKKNHGGVMKKIIL